MIIYKSPLAFASDIANITGYNGSSKYLQELYKNHFRGKKRILMCTNVHYKILAADYMKLMNSVLGSKLNYSDVLNAKKYMIFRTTKLGHRQILPSRLLSYQLGNSYFVVCKVEDEHLVKAKTRCILGNGIIFLFSTREYKALAEELLPPKVKHINLTDMYHKSSVFVTKAR